jgi:hypothetical protein
MGFLVVAERSDKRAIQWKNKIMLKHHNLANDKMISSISILVWSPNQILKYYKTSLMI